jgi:DNA-binding CsgD family transcriptional regulator
VDHSKERVKVARSGPEPFVTHLDHGPQRNEDTVDTGIDVSTIGPMQLIAVRFAPQVGFVDAIIAEIDRLQGHGVLRLLDVLVLTMEDSGSLTRVEIADEDFGDLLIADAQLDPADVLAMFEGRGVEVSQSERAQALAQSLVPGSGLALILVEHRWARPLFDSIADLGGVVFSEGFIAEQTEKLVEVQLAALDDTARVIDDAYAAQTEAVAASAAAIEAAQRKADEVAVAASVTAVELQVLRYLPTKMTFALLADKLEISRSAAKERAERAYKKLGVHNRTDAVARARELGLIRHVA